MIEVAVRQTMREDWEDLYRREGSRLWRAILAYSGDPEVASDSVSEAFAQALRRAALIRSKSAWIWRAAFRIASGEMKERRRSRSLSADDLQAAQIAEVPSDSLIDALRLVSPHQRASLILFYYGGYKVNEIAHILRSTGPAVRVHLSVGRKRLREVLEKEIADGTN